MIFLSRWGLCCVKNSPKMLHYFAAFRFFAADKKHARRVIWDSKTKNLITYPSVSSGLAFALSYQVSWVSISRNITFFDTHTEDLSRRQFLEVPRTLYRDVCQPDTALRSLWVNLTSTTGISSCRVISIPSWITTTSTNSYMQLIFVWKSSNFDQ